MRGKRIITGLMVLGLAGCSSQDLESIRLSVDDKELEVGDTVSIDVEMEPNDVKIDEESFTVKGKGDGKLTVDDEDVSFEATKEGSVQITLSQNGATSNTLILEIEDDKTKDSDDDADDLDDNNDTSENNQTYTGNTQSPSTDPYDDDQSDTDDSYSDDTIISWSQSDPLSVEEVISNQNLLLKTTENIWIEGLLPQTDINGKMVLYADNRVQYLVLNDPNGLINFGSTEAIIVGTLSQSGNDIVLTVSQAYKD